MLSNRRTAAAVLSGAVLATAGWSLLAFCAPAPEPTVPAEPVPTPTLVCDPGFVPGWLDENGNPQGCVNNGPIIDECLEGDACWDWDTMGNRTATGVLQVGTEVIEVTIVANLDGTYTATRR